AVLDAADIEPLLTEAHAFAFRADAVARRHAHVLEHDFPRLVAHHGFVAGAELHARRIHVDDEAGNAAARALRAVGRDHELHEIGVAGAGDEALDAVDQVVIAPRARRWCACCRDRSRRRARSARTALSSLRATAAAGSSPSL